MKSITEITANCIYQLKYTMNVRLRTPPSQLVLPYISGVLTYLKLRIQPRITCRLHSSEKKKSNTTGLRHEITLFLLDVY